MTETKEPQPPADLKDPEARKEWRRITTVLAKERKSRPLSEADRAALVIYCTSYALYTQAQKQIEEHGAVILSNAGSPIKNPYVAIQKQAFDRLKPLLSALGLTPQSRAAQKLDEGADDGPGDFF